MTENNFSELCVMIRRDGFFNGYSSVTAFFDLGETDDRREFKFGSIFICIDQIAHLDIYQLMMKRIITEHGIMFINEQNLKSL